MNRIMASLAILTGAVGVSVAQVNPLIVREGEATRRTQLNAMELKPFSIDALAKLSDWQNGGAIGEGDIAGKVVLIATWGDWYQPSKRAASFAVKMAEKFGKQGLITILVHHERGWENAKKPVAPAGAIFRVAHDPKGEFRNALLVDQDPDFYLVDRAGQLRYADVQLESVETAISELIAEKVDAAATLNERMAAEKEEKQRELVKSQALRTSVKFASIPEQAFTPPNEEEYERADWPGFLKMSNGRWSPIQHSAASLSPLDLSTVVVNQHQAQLKGRAVLFYLYAQPVRGDPYEQTAQNSLPPDIANEVFDRAEALARHFGRDLLVVGVIESEVLPKLLEGREWSDNHVICSDSQRREELLRVLSAGTGKFMITTTRPTADNDALVTKIADVSAIYPLEFLLSSDEKVRAWWRFPPESTDSIVSAFSLHAAISQVIKVDPGVKARKAAEDAYIKANPPK